MYAPRSWQAALCFLQLAPNVRPPKQLLTDAVCVVWLVATDVPDSLDVKKKKHWLLPF